jgi:hypothetical protein
MLRTSLLLAGTFALGGLLASACTEADSCADQAATSSCCCFEFVAEEGPGQLINHCDAPATCGELRGDCPPDDFMHARCAPQDVAALDCVLQAMQAGASARVRWITEPVFTDQDTYYLARWTADLYISGDGSVFYTGTHDTGFTYVHEPAARHDLASLDLGACAVMTDAQARFDCLRAAFTAAPAETCVDPYAK